MARTAEVTENKVLQFLLDNCDMSTPHHSWIDDCVRGRIPTINGKDSVSKGLIIMLLQSLPTISVESVGQSINRKQLALYGRPYSLRHVQNVTAMVRGAHNAIYTHLYLHHKDQLSV